MCNMNVEWQATKTTDDNCNRADKLKTGEKHPNVTIRIVFVTHKSHNKFPSAFWNDKFPSAGNELMRDITKDHVCRRENEQRTKKKEI